MSVFVLQPLITSIFNPAYVYSFELTVHNVGAKPYEILVQTFQNDMSVMLRLHTLAPKPDPLSSLTFPCITYHVPFTVQIATNSMDPNAVDMTMLLRDVFNQVVGVVTKPMFTFVLP